MSKSAELISNVYKDRHNNSLSKNHPDPAICNIKIDTSKFSVEYETIEFSDDNFMYIKIALISKVIAEIEDN